MVSIILLYPLRTGNSKEVKLLLTATQLQSIHLRELPLRIYSGRGENMGGERKWRGRGRGPLVLKFLVLLPVIPTGWVKGMCHHFCVSQYGTSNLGFVKKGEHCTS